MTGIPAAVARHIETLTGLDPRLGRRARAGACRKCSAPVVRGLDGDMCAFLTATDPRRLTPEGELLALLGGRDTFTLDGHPPQLTHRTRHDIRTRPPGRHIVLVEHQCNAPPLPAYPDMPAEREDISRRESSEPPF